MVRFILPCFLLLNGIISYPQTNQFNQTTFDTIAKEEVLIGYCTREGLEKGIFESYFNDEYKNYKPESTVIQALSGQLSDISTTIIMGTWCSDSREQVPRFFRILDAINAPHGQITIICVNKKKLCKDLSLDEYALNKVPTFIFKRNSAEAGRIVETPTVSIEKDLLSIINK